MHCAAVAVLSPAHSASVLLSRVPLTGLKTLNMLLKRKGVLAEGDRRCTSD
jgi:hypothetical protein